MIKQRAKETPPSHPPLGKGGRRGGNEKGIALVMILILAAIALAIMAGMIYMITSGTQVSGLQKRYTTALEAGKAGADVTYQFIGARGDPGILNINFYQTLSSACLAAKMNFATSSTDSNGWSSNCSNFSNTTSMSINKDDPSTYDMYFDLGSSPYPTYRVYSKIVDTVEGNSGGDEGLVGKGVVASGSGEVQVVSRPYLYTIEVDAENRDNPAERAKLSILYQY
jgi:hypothetical protein